MNWDNIRIFLAVARAGQMLGAARRLALNHATVSRRLTALETAAKTRLFERTTAGMVLTEAGLHLLEAAERMEAEVLALSASLPDENGQISGTVRIGAPDGFGVAFLAPRLQALTDEFDGLTIQLVPVPQSFSFSRREADIVITVERPHEGRLIASKLVDYTLALYASKNYLLRYGMPVTREQLRNHHLVGYVEDLVINASLDYASSFDPDWQTRYQISSALGQMEAVLSGAGIGILHRFIASQHDTLVQVDALPAVHRTYWLVYHQSLKPVRRIQTVARYIAMIVEKERKIFR